MTEVRNVGVLIVDELALNQSLLVAWPQIVALLGLTVAAFAAAYIAFMRQEIRA